MIRTASCRAVAVGLTRCAIVACVTLTACGSTEGGPGAPASGPGASGSGDLVLPDADATYLANVALDAWALGRSAVGYQLDGCSRTDQATAECVATIQFADNPANPQTCSLAITVVAATPTVGVQEPTPATPSLELETEEYSLPSGGYGTYSYGDATECEQAQYRSGF